MQDTESLPNTLSETQQIRRDSRRAGRVEEARHIVLQLGRHRWGEPDDTSRLRLESITDLDELERIAERVLDVSCWEEMVTDSCCGQEPLD